MIELADTALYAHPLSQCMPIRWTRTVVLDTGYHGLVSLACGPAEECHVRGGKDGLVVAEESVEACVVQGGGLPAPHPECGRRRECRLHVRATLGVYPSISAWQTVLPHEMTPLGPKDEGNRGVVREMLTPEQV